jgi:hypothetical protein
MSLIQELASFERDNLLVFITSEGCIKKKVWPNVVKENTKQNSLRQISTKYLRVPV